MTDPTPNTDETEAEAEAAAPVYQMEATESFRSGHYTAGLVNRGAVFDSDHPVVVGAPSKFRRLGEAVRSTASLPAPPAAPATPPPAPSPDPAAGSDGEGQDEGDDKAPAKKAAAKAPAKK